MADQSESANSAHPPQQFLLLHAVQLPACLSAGGILLLLLLGIRWQGILHLSIHFIGGSSRDAGLYIWLTQSVARDLFENPWFYTQALYPYAGTLAWSDNFILTGLLARPFFALDLPVQLVFNLLLLLAQFLNGFCAYYFCFRITGSHIPSVASACAFLALSYFSGNLGHPQLLCAFWFPAAFSTLFTFLQSPSLWRAALLGVLVSGAFLTTVYFSLFILIAIAILWLCVISLHPRHYSFYDFARFTAGLLLGLSLLIPFLPPYFSVREAFGERAIYEAHYFSATALSYFSFSPFNLIYRWTSDFSHEEAFLGTGVFLLIFCVVAFIRAFGVAQLRSLTLTLAGFLASTSIFSLESMHRIPLLTGAVPNYLCTLSMWGALASLFLLLYRLGTLERDLRVAFFTNRDLIAIFIALAVVSFLISLGPQGNPEKGHLALGVCRVLYELVPGFNSIRAISRIGLVTLFSLTVLLALALTYCKNNLSWKPGILAAIGIAIILENVPFTIPVEEPLPSPTVLETLRKQAQPEDVVLFLPMAPGTKPNGQVKSWGDFAHVNTIYMNWLFPLNLPLVNGYSGQRSKLMREYPGQLAQFPDTRSLQTLATIAGLRFVIFSSQFSPNFNQQEFTKGIENARESLNYIQGDAFGNYLLEYVGAQNLSVGSFSLWVPAWPRRILEFELKALYDPKLSDVSVDVMIPDLIPEVSFHTLNVPANGEWAPYRIELPTSSERIRPHRLTFFPSPPNAQVLLRRTRVLSLKELEESL